MLSSILPVAFAAAALCACSAFAANPVFSAGSSRVEFTSGGQTIAGTLRLPAGFTEGEQVPVILVAGSWTTVKEQMADTYAARLTGEGFATLTFDFRNWGESGGEPRHFENPATKIEDIAAAANYAKSLPITQDGQIGTLAVCASAGYAAYAINNGAPIRSLVTVAAWIHDPETAKPIYGGEEGVAKRIADARAAVAAESKGEPTRTVPACSATDQSAAMYGPFDYYLNPARGAINQWPNRFAVRSWEPWLTFDGVSAAKKLAVPTLFVHGDGCALSQNVRAIAAAMGDRASTLWMPGMHFDFYDQPRQVDAAVAAAASHFRSTLSTSTAPITSPADRDSIIAAVNAVGSLADARKWPDLRAVFADNVDVDYTSLVGGQPSRVKADDLITGWEKGLTAFAKTEHVVSGHQVTVNGDTAECRARFIATHTRGTPDSTDRWTCGGRYRYTLNKVHGQWKVSGTVMTMEWEQGKR